MPCMKRAAIRMPIEGANPQHAEAVVNRKEAGQEDLFIAQVISQRSDGEQQTGEQADGDQR